MYSVSQSLYLIKCLVIKTGYETERRHQNVTYDGDIYTNKDDYKTHEIELKKTVQNSLTTFDCEKTRALRFPLGC